MTSNLVKDVAAAISPSVGDLADNYAIRILSLVLEKDRAGLYSLPSDFALSLEQQDSLNKYISALSAGQPIVQLEKETEFCGYRVQISAEVLIPRPETELLTEMFMAGIRQHSAEHISILEVGTGSGCITMAVIGQLLSSKQSFTYIASEISEAARTCTVENLAQFKPEISYYDERVELDWELGKAIIYSEGVPKIAHYPLQYVIANPPYLTETEFDALDISVKKYEPKLALTDLKDGLTVYRQIADYLRMTHQRPLPALFLELSPSIAAAVNEIFREIYASPRLKLLEDQFGRTRYLIATA